MPLLLHTIHSYHRKSNVYIHLPMYRNYTHPIVLCCLDLPLTTMSYPNVLVFVLRIIVSILRRLLPTLASSFHSLSFSFYIFFFLHFISKNINLFYYIYFLF